VQPGIMGCGTWAMKEQMMLCVLSAVGEKESMVMLLHCRMGHLSFDKNV
jgi:hypothetical protein